MLQLFQIQKRNYLFDVFIGILIGMPFGAIIVLIDTSAFFNDVFPLVKDYQTLLAGFLASGVALISIGRLNRQLKQAQQFRENDRIRQLTASKVMLPVALDNLHNYAEKCLKLTVDICRGLDVDRSLPPLDSNNFRILSACAESADAESSEMIRIIVQSYQIQSARLRTCLQKHQPEKFLDAAINRRADERAVIRFGEMCSVLELLNYIDELWSFARDNEDSPSPETRVERARLRLQHIDFIENSVHWGEMPKWPKFLELFESVQNRKNEEANPSLT